MPIFSNFFCAGSPNYLDRALSARSVSADEFRRDAVAAIYLAAKVEGAAEFKAADVAALTRGNVTAEDLIAAEADLVKTLQWRTVWKSTSELG